MMDWFVRAFVQASLGWLTLGVSLGLAMAVHPAWTVYHPAHAHMNLLGFVTMMIYGVAYHVIPRFTGRPLRHRWLAGAQWYASNGGLALMVVGFVLRANASAIAGPALALGGVFAALGAYAFVFNIWRTLASRPSDASTRRDALPVARSSGD